MVTMAPTAASANSAARNQIKTLRIVFHQLSSVSPRQNGTSRLYHEISCAATLASAAAQGEFISPGHLKSPKGGAALWAAEPKQKDTLFSVSFCLELDIDLDIYSSEDPAFWLAAPLRRTSVFAFGENLGAGRIHFARALKITEGWSRPLGGGTQTKRHAFQRVFLFGTAEGIRTPDLLVRSQTLYPTELQPRVRTRGSAPPLTA